MACAISANTNQILEVADRRPDALAVCGGLARSPLFLEILANVLNLPVRVPRWREGTGVGTAICAGVGAGIYKDIAEGVSTLVQPECVVEPTPALSEQYKQVYASWIRTRETLNTIQPSPF
jgi:autoinducer 2 (AI-2) kinase